MTIPRSEQIAAVESHAEDDEWDSKVAESECRRILAKSLAHRAAALRAAAQSLRDGIIVRGIHYDSPGEQHDVFEWTTSRGDVLAVFIDTKQDTVSWAAMKKDGTLQAASPEHPIYPAQSLRAKADVEAIRAVAMELDKAGMPGNYAFSRRLLAAVGGGE